MFQKEFALRLALLRSQKGVSARDMSLSLGQSPGYINAIENEKAFPTMEKFFYICEFLGVTPQEFFDFSPHPPEKLDTLTEKIKHLSRDQLDALTIIVDGLTAASK